MAGWPVVFQRAVKGVRAQNSIMRSIPASAIDPTTGGAGSGTGQFVPGVAGGVHGVDDFGAVIMPAASWAQGDAAAPAAFLVDASAGQMPMCAVERLWVDGSNAGTTLIHGIAAPRAEAD